MKFIQSKLVWGVCALGLMWVFPYIPTYFTPESLEEARMKRNAINQVVVTNANAVVSTFTDQYSQSLAAQQEAAQQEKEAQLAAQEQQRNAELEAQQAPVREVADSVKVLANGVAQMGGNFSATLGDVNGRVANLEQSIGGLNAKLDSVAQLVVEKNSAQAQTAPVSNGQVTVTKGTQGVAPIKSNCPPNCDCQKGSVQYGAVQPVGNRVHSYRTR
jgi:hypothetical protein